MPKVLTASTTVLNALRDASQIRRITANDSRRTTRSAEVPFPDTSYQGPFRVTMTYSSRGSILYIQDAMRTYDTEHAGYIYTAGGHLLGKAPAATLHPGWTTSTQCGVILCVIDFRQSPSANNWISYVLSSRDDNHYLYGDYLCRFPVALYRNESTGFYSVLQVQTGDYWVRDHIGYWYEEE